MYYTWLFYRRLVVRKEYWHSQRHYVLWLEGGEKFIWKVTFGSEKNYGQVPEVLGKFYQRDIYSPGYDLQVQRYYQTALSEMCIVQQINFTYACWMSRHFWLIDLSQTAPIACSSNLAISQVHFDDFPTYSVLLLWQRRLCCGRSWKFWQWGLPLRSIPSLHFLSFPCEIGEDLSSRVIIETDVKVNVVHSA